MAKTLEENEDTLKHNWIAQALIQQTSFTRFFGYCEYHDVPEENLRGKLESCYKMIGDQKKAEKNAENVKKRILEKNQTAPLSYQLKPIFVHVATKDFKKSGVYLIFRVKLTDSGEPIYIDEIRTYTDWQDFLENNTLPRYYLFYPENGNYISKTEFKMEESAACSVKKIARTVTKVTAVTATIVSSIALAATPALPVLAPVTIPLIAVTAGGSAIMGIDGVVQVVDLVKHDEKMSPINPRALDAYLDIGSAFGGLFTGGASAAARFLSEDAAMMAKVLRCVKIAGSSIQGVSLIGKCLTPFFAELSLEDFKEFCLCCLNTIVHGDIPYAKIFISFFMLGIAVYTGNTAVQSLVTLNGFRDCTVFLFEALFPVVLSILSPKVKELSEYFCNVLCTKLSPLLPTVIDTNQFQLMKRDFFSVIEKASMLFNVSDVLDIKFNGFRFFVMFSISALRLVCDAFEKHLQCKKNETQHDLTQPELVKLWFEFMDLIRCCSPQKLASGTDFLLKMVSRRNELEYAPPSSATLPYYAETFLNMQGSSPQFNEDEPLFPTLNGMQIYEFYAPNVEDDMSVLSEKLKEFYREKAEIILRRTVNKENSKFHKAGNGANSVLYLSESHEWKAIVFNRTILENGNVMLFVTLLQ